MRHTSWVWALSSGAAGKIRQLGGVAPVGECPEADVFLQQPQGKIREVKRHRNDVDESQADTAAATTRNT